jgi:hypothetical protein
MNTPDSTTNRSQGPFKMTANYTQPAKANKQAPFILAYFLPPPSAFEEWDHQKDAVLDFHLKALATILAVYFAFTFAQSILHEYVKSSWSLSYYFHPIANRVQFIAHGYLARWAERQRRDQKKDTEQAEHTNLEPDRCRICNQSKITKPMLILLHSHSMIAKFTII